MATNSAIIEEHLNASEQWIEFALPPEQYLAYLCLRNIQLFKQFESAQIVDLAFKLHYHVYHAGNDVLWTEKPENKLFIVKSGMLEVDTKDGKNYIYRAGSVFGNLSKEIKKALSFDSIEPKSVQTLSVAETYVLNESDLTRIVCITPP